MDIKETNIDNIIPYARNPRKNHGAIASVAASLKEYGWQQPIVVDGEMVVIVGHTRLLAARQLGLDVVPVLVANGLSVAQVKAYRIMDNKSGEMAEWDFDLLAIEIEDLGELDFDLDKTGFTKEEIRDVNLEIDDIEDVDHFNETFNFSVSCDDLTELAQVQHALGCAGKKITAKKLIEIIK